ncbi:MULTISPECIES: hypothetical protein [unclassified Prochlorococcus]|uniref:hypothetical protein n=1 Tax=unclassified Prochlorococcus TaxID=2627481 RepID=UPI00053397C3|nr:MULTISPECIES: hypothetical protein [unclassified Prochlorococcus]KGG16867.1 hypothetical protein EV06_0713 [Prochlorococcus sp. MIT 0602]KGG18159.1 hypothetical protein EV07_0071 [Prochlorococcus sp. MIT 0603]
MSQESDVDIDSPLSVEEIALIENSGLSVSDRHFLKLLAHCLSCFKEMSNFVESGSLPNEAIRFEWLMMKYKLKRDQAFASVLLEQFGSAAYQLELLAKRNHISPLELKLDHLIEFFQTSEEERN